jgi:hypothetical protein
MCCTVLGNDLYLRFTKQILILEEMSSMKKSQHRRSQNQHFKELSSESQKKEASSVVSNQSKGKDINQSRTQPEYPVELVDPEPDSKVERARALSGDPAYSR